ncbi:hypothetical protein A2914_00875 [Candidatus Nomurabacteria bacterium RIFCSPLOWO2_01_FULL_41_21]|uniref:HTH cro/C1-type domain-containing protein n=2 Tax=Candidatus Nomuraibacteriota TaxID=1752729 RepID=A0A1F6V2R4_9BACT|nr:MAG: hypothetical protein A2733_01965 [Candidatus Nomurabacteria bacterium RIFCSPHIGHO2_01_FULL_40_20]OGI87869.1 MAG: hypothetical protein A2914_00875 [Candidatus Nomurabacteria bacterium RIFCSPLOWO2_01_FULL_41_21]
MLAYVLEFYREIRGYTRFELEGLTGIPAHVISEFESGKILPDTAQLEALGKVFRVPSDLLLRMAKNEEIEGEILEGDSILIEHVFRSYMKMKIKGE